MSKITLDNYEAYLLDFSEGKLSADDIRMLDGFLKLHPELDIRSELGALPELTVLNESFDEKADLLKAEVYFEDEKLIGYIEGLLSPQEIISFENELKENAILRQTLALYQASRLSKDVLDFNKTFLYKNEEDLLLANAALNYVEGGMSDEERLSFETKMNSTPTLKNDVILLSKTKLVADERIVFENKESLKKEGRVIVLFSWKTVARVAAVLLLVFSLLLPFYLNRNTNNGQKVAATKPTPAVETKQPNSQENKTVPSKTFDNTIETFTKEDPKVVTPAKESKKESANRFLAIVPEKERSEQVPASNPDQINQIEKEILVAATNNETVKEQATTKDSVAAFESFANISELQFTEEIEDLEPAKPEGGFWRRAVGLAKQANKLGVKSIDGEENTSVKYRLSFNSFSVEKR